MYTFVKHRYVIRIYKLFQPIAKVLKIDIHFICVEREADWCLHMVSLKRMLPYFFAAGHVNFTSPKAFTASFVDESRIKQDL